MLTEDHHNVAGVKDLIDGMVIQGSFSNSEPFNRAVMDFLLAFSEHVGEKYGLKSYNKFLQQLWYRENLYDEDSELLDEFDLEQGLYNTLRTLAMFFNFFVKELSIKNQSPQDGDEDAFLFTTIRIARKLQKEYMQVADDIISRKAELSGSLSESDIMVLVSKLESFKEIVAGFDFGGKLLTKRQRARKHNELYGSGARTNQPAFYSSINKDEIKRNKLGNYQKERDITNFDPWDRKKKFKFRQEL